MPTKQKFPNLSNSEIEDLVRQISDLRMTLAGITDDQEAGQRECDAELLPIREKYRPAQERRAKVIESLSVSIDEGVETLRLWAVAVEGEHFTDRRSLNLVHGVIGFRLSKPRLEERPNRTFKRAAYWLARVVWGKRYLNAPTVNKAAILKDRATFDARPERLRKLGLEIVQDDTFYVETKQTASDLHFPAPSTARLAKEAA